MEQYSRQDLLAATGASPQELAEIEARRVLVPIRRYRLFRGFEEYFTVDQCEVLRQMIRTRRLIELQRSQLAPAPRYGLGQLATVDDDHEFGQGRPV